LKSQSSKSEKIFRMKNKIEVKNKWKTGKVDKKNYEMMSIKYSHFFPFLAATFLAGLLAAVFLAGALFGAAFLTGAFLAAVFFAGALLATTFFAGALAIVYFLILIC